MDELGSIPGQKKYIDLERRRYHIPKGAIKSSMLSPEVISTLSIQNGLVGIYGTAKYGRSVYGYLTAIYGTDKYGEAHYY